MKKSIALIIALTFFCLSCSRLDFASKFAATYVVYKADEYFDLTSTQKDWLRKEFEKSFVVVKREMIPKVSKELYRLSTISNQRNEFSFEDLEAEYKKLNTLLIEATAFFAESAMSFVNQLSPDQVDYFQKRFQTGLLDFQENSNEKKTSKRLKSSFGNWFGELSTFQEKAIEKFVTDNPFPIELFIDHRQKIVREFKEVYTERERRNLFVKTLFINYSSTLDSAYRFKKKERDKNLIKLVVLVLNSMTVKQKKYVALFLNEKANQLLKIN